MTKPKSTLVIYPHDLERQIFVVRGQRVMIDAHLAVLYGVSTRALNQAVARNPDRFPSDFAYQLTQQEFTDLKSQIVTSKSARGGTQKLAWVFTEHGVAMLSSVLRSPRAVQVNIGIMRAFVRMRRLMATPGELVQQLSELAKTVQFHDGQIAVITDVLRRMAEQPATQPKRKIGFRPEARTPHESNGQTTGTLR
jgi:hypothetical protein